MLLVYRLVLLYIVYKTNKNNNWCSGPCTKSILDPCSLAEAQFLLGLDDPLFPQSGVETEHASQEREQVITTFVDEEPGFEEVINDAPDDIRRYTHETSMDIREFFARPVPIWTHNWIFGDANQHMLFNPWDLWMKNKRVANRLTNYKNFSGTLCVKVLLNGNQFYWGSALLSHCPAFLNQRIRTYTNNILDIVPASQRLHLWLEPTTNEGGCMRLPFLYNYDAMHLPDATPAALDALGRLWFTVVTALAHESSTRSVRVTYYAWVDDIVLSSPTAVNMNGLTAQSGDEYSRKPVSTMATSVASVASKLTSMPTIGPFALATQQVANAVGSMAAAMGYSKPTHLQEPHRVRKQMFNSMSTGDGQDECDVLALTQKHEVTIDPRTVGLDSTDEMDLNYICGIESYIGRAPWTAEDPANKILCSMPVSPFVCQTAIRAGTLGTGTVFPPCGHLGRLFDYWRGNMVFRFRVVASKFHKGRLLVVWDPVVATVNPESNLTNSMVVDIAETRDFEVKIGWGSDKPALTCMEALGDPRFFVGSVCPYKPYDNGYLTVYVLNDLVDSSNSTLPIHLQVFVKGEDMDFWAPDYQGFDSTYFPQPQSGWEQQPFDSMTRYSFGNTAPHDDVVAICMGERVRSVRTLLKRYMHDYTFSWLTETAANNPKVLKFVRNVQAPYQPGFDPQGVDTFGPDVCNNLKHSYWSYIEPLFVGKKGGRRLKILARSDINTVPQVLDTFNVSRGGDQTAGTSVSASYNILDPSQVRKMIAGETQELASGGIVLTKGSDGTAEVAVKWYSGTRFDYCQRSPLSLSGSNQLIIRHVQNVVGTPLTVFTLFSASDEDVALFRWNGTLPLWPWVIA